MNVGIIQGEISRMLGDCRPENIHDVKEYIKMLPKQYREAATNHARTLFKNKQKKEI